MKLFRTVGVGLGAVLVIAGAGCGGTSPGDARSTSPDSSAAVTVSPSKRTLTAVERCGGTELMGATTVRIPLAGDALYGIQAGTGARAVLLIHGSGQRGVCVWRQEIPALAAAGFRVLAIDHRCVGESTCTASATDLVADIAEAVRHLRATGATAVTVIGASAGTAQVIVAAGTPAVPLTAAVALSPGRLDDDVRSGGEVPRTARQAAPRIRVPTLYVVAADDPLSSVPDTKALHDATPQTYRRLVSLPSGGHAQALLYRDGASAGAPAGPVYDGVLAFLRRSA